jgi:hypothetical protein
MEMYLIKVVMLVYRLVYKASNQRMTEGNSFQKAVGASTVST